MSKIKLPISIVTFVLFLNACGGGQPKTFDYSTVPSTVGDWESLKRCSAPENLNTDACKTYRHAVTYQ